jgi:hypothetical protein
MTECRFGLVQSKGHRKTPCAQRCIEEDSEGIKHQQPRNGENEDNCTIAKISSWFSARGMREASTLDVLSVSVADGLLEDTDRLRGIIFHGIPRERVGI